MLLGERLGVPLGCGLRRGVGWCHGVAFCSGVGINMCVCGVNPVSVPYGSSVERG